MPAPPKPLEGEALEEWDRLTARLEHTGVLSVVDDAILYQHCRLFAETEAIHVTQRETGESIRTIQDAFDRQPADDVTSADRITLARIVDTLQKVEAGYISKVRQGRMALGVMLMELGLTPSTRNRVRPSDQVGTLPGGDAFTAFQRTNPSVQSFESQR